MKSAFFSSRFLSALSALVLSFVMLVQFGFAQSENPAFRIDSNGNIGVGVQPSGSAKLEVDGTVSATSFVGDGSGLTGLSSGYWQKYTNNNNIYYDSANVGIGISNPSHLLEVAAVDKSLGVGANLGANQSTGLQFLDYGTQHAGLRWGGGSNGANGNLYLENASSSVNPNSWYSSGSPVNLVVRNGSVAATKYCDQNLSSCVTASSALPVLGNLVNHTTAQRSCTLSRSSNDGTSSATLGTWDFCFLTRVKIEGEDDSSSDYADCNIDVSSSNSWSFSVSAGSDKIDQVKCQARCLNFNGIVPSDFDNDNKCS